MALSMADLPSIFSLLTNVLSQDSAVREPAEAALAECESRPGFCSCLLEIVSAQTLASHTEVRLLATVYFKNSVNRYWRHRRDSYGISSDEKAYLRKKLVTDLREEADKVALQRAVLISKIARIEYPKEWPELFTTLAQQMQCADLLTSHRVHMVLFRCLKELSTKRLSVDQRNFAEICSHLLDYTWNLWQSDLQTILQNLANLSQSVSWGNLHLICERWLLCLKIIRQMILFGFLSDTRTLKVVPPVKDICPALLKAVQSFLPFYSSLCDGKSKLLAFMMNSCCKLMKVLVLIQSHHPYSFGDVQVLGPSLEFCLNTITNPEPYLVSSEELLIQCMLMVMSIVDCVHYKPIPTGSVVNGNGTAPSFDERKIAAAKDINATLSSILPGGRITFLCNILVQRYFIFSQKDLEEWHNDPEVFYHEQDQLQKAERLRPCAESLFITIFESHSNLLGPCVLSIVHEAMTACPASVTEVTPQMLTKEAAYCSAGYSYYELSKFLNFKAWYEGALSIELSNKHPNQRIIHRRVAWILGKWVSEVSSDLRKSVYNALVGLLLGSDLAVKLAAVRSLNSLIDDDNFVHIDPSECFPACWDIFFHLVDEVEMFDSKVQVINLIALIIDRLGARVTPHARKLVEFFQKLWEGSSGESLLQVQLLLALKNFVVSLGSQSPLSYDVVLPILRHCIDIANPDELVLIEDGMLLWEATVTQASSVSAILDLFPSLVAIMERNLDHLRVAADIIEGYILVGSGEFLNAHAATLVKVFNIIVNNVNDKGMARLFSLVEKFLKWFPRDAPLLISEVAQYMALICLSRSYDNEPSKALVKSIAASVLARLMVVNTEYLSHLTSQPVLAIKIQQAGVPVEHNLLLSLIDAWLEKAENVPFSRRKTIALGLTIALTLRDSQILEKLEQIISVCTSVMLDDDRISSAQIDLTELQNDNLDLSTMDRRKLEISVADEFERLSLASMLKQNLNTCAAIHGDALFNAAMSRIHPSIQMQLQQALTM